MKLSSEHSILSAANVRPTLGGGVAAGALPGAMPRAPIRMEHTDTDGTTLFNERFSVADASLKLHDILRNELPEDRRHILETMQKRFAAAKADGIAERNKIKRELDNIESERRDLEAFQIATIDLMRWQKAGLRLERPNGSVMHHLLDAIAERRIRLLYAAAAGMPADWGAGFSHLIGQSSHSFVVEHDWAAVFDSASEFSGEDFRLPYDSMCFEFRVAGRNVCAMLTSNGDRKLLAPFVDTDQGWVIPKYVYMQDGERPWRPTTTLAKPGDDEFAQLQGLITNQVRAICISLEAEVSTTEVIRASYRLNRSREKRGRAPIADYHVIRLAHRHRAFPRAEHPGDEIGTRKRLHFRRGHWRHFVGHRTWINWTLVGDPDLGFIDKHYRL